MDLQRFTTIVMRSLPGIVLLTVVAAGAAFAVSMVLPKQWESEARLLVGSLTETDTQQLDAYQQLASTYSEVATSTPTMLRVIDRLGLPDDTKTLAKRVTIRAEVGQAIIRITAEADDPQAAADLANAFASEIVKLGLPAPRSSTSLVSRYQPGDPPVDPSSPKILINTLIAAAVGFVVGVGLAVLLAMVRDSRAAAADRRRGAPTTALVPTVAPALGAAPGRNTPAWPMGVGPGTYPPVAVTAVAPMPRTAERMYEAPQIAEASGAPPPRPQAPSAYGPQPVRTEPYVAAPPSTTLPPANPVVAPSGPTFLEIIEARTAPPPRPSVPAEPTVPVGPIGSSAAVPASTNGASADAPSGQHQDEPASVALSPPVAAPSKPPPTIPLAPAPSRPSTTLLPASSPAPAVAAVVAEVMPAVDVDAPSPSSAAAAPPKPAAEVVADTPAAITADAPAVSPRPAARRTRAKPAAAAPEVEVPQPTVAAPPARRSTTSRSARASSAADASPVVANGPDAVASTPAATTRTSRKKASPSTPEANPGSVDGSPAPVAKPKARKSTSAETEAPLVAPVPPPTSRTRKPVAPAPQA